MKLIGISSQKGGVGKTTLAMNLAVASAQSGQPTIIFDMDPQQSCKTYHRIRTGAGHNEQPMVVAATVATIEDTLRKAAADGYEVGIIDTPPNVVTADAKVAAGADVVLVPVTPSVLDLAAIQASIEISNMKDAKGFAILNMVKHYGDHAEDARSAIENDFKFPVAGPTIGDRMALKNAAREGQSVLETEPSSKAAAEVQALWKFVDAALNAARAKTPTRKEAVNG